MPFFSNRSNPSTQNSGTLRILAIRSERIERLPLDTFRDRYAVDIVYQLRGVAVRKLQAHITDLREVGRCDRSKRHGIEVWPGGTVKEPGKVLRPRDAVTARQNQPHTFSCGIIRKKCAENNIALMR